MRKWILIINVARAQQIASACVCEREREEKAMKNQN